MRIGLAVAFSGSSRLEITRLLYVGATRAIKKLTLSACLAGGDDCAPDELPDLKSPGEAALLAPIWSVFEAQMKLHSPQIQADPVASPDSGILRLQSFPTPPPTPPVDLAQGSNIPPAAFNWMERHVGTVIHELLEILSGTSPLPQSMTSELTEVAQFSLASLGSAGDDLQQGLQRVLIAVQATLDDQRWGRWLLSTEHQQAYSELALTIDDEGSPRDIVIDRTFVDQSNGVRWVVDYKSAGPPAEVPLDVFLQEESERYQDQLRLYRDAMQKMGPEPVRCALYFTSIGMLHSLSQLDT